MLNLLLFTVVITHFTAVICMQNIETKPVNQTYIVDCNKLRMGQYMCPDPRISQIDLKTQQFKGCTRENKAKGKQIIFCFCKISM